VSRKGLQRGETAKKVMAKRAARPKPGMSFICEYFEVRANVSMLRRQMVLEVVARKKIEIELLFRELAGLESMLEE
jgi:hypothetical protein